MSRVLMVAAALAVAPGVGVVLWWLAACWRQERHLDRLAERRDPK